MNLTEVLLAVIIGLLVVAGSYFLYTNISEKNAMTQTMQNISLLRANIEDIYDGDYSDDTFGDLTAMNKLGILPEYFVRVSQDAASMKTRWGSVSLAQGDDSSQYLLSLDGLTGDACVHFARFQTNSWARISVNATDIWDRETGTKPSVKDIADVCTANGNTIKFVAP